MFNSLLSLINLGLPPLLLYLQKSYHYEIYKSSPWEAVYHYVKKCAGIRQNWIQKEAPPLTSWVILAKSLNHSEPEYMKIPTTPQGCC